MKQIRFYCSLFFIFIFLISPFSGFAQQKKMSNVLNWIRTGGPLGGLGYDVRIRPDNPDIMYVTDAFAGVFKSADGDKTGHRLTRALLPEAGLQAMQFRFFA